MSQSNMDNRLSAADNDVDRVISSVSPVTALPLNGPMPSCFAVTVSSMVSKFIPALLSILRILK